MDPSQVDIYDLLEQRRLVADIGQEEISTDSRDTVMALQMYIREDHVQLLSGYESGRMVLRIISGDKADTVWVTKRHSSPVLSVSARPDMNLLFSVCTDGVVVKSPLFEQDPAATKQTHTKSGLEQVCVRDDAKIIATAGWDNRIRVFSAKTLKPLAVLSFHRESIYAVAFASLPSDHHYLVGGSKDHRISIWNIY
ncbi:hypothetical protein NQZ79_g6213 [Umbelopsis isabellina]|nr:hypothetical protein NQZ79_g6213 [Umbelopsis isabellina]